MPRFCIALCSLVLGASIAAGECQAQNVKAVEGVAAGRDIRDSQINIGITGEQLKSAIEAAAKGAEQQETINALQKHLGVNEEALKAFFAILGENEVPIEQLTRKLVEIA